MYAVEMGYQEICALLTEHGADPNITSKASWSNYTLSRKQSVWHFEMLSSLIYSAEYVAKFVARSYDFNKGQKERCNCTSYRCILAAS